MTYQWFKAPSHYFGFVRNDKGVVQHVGSVDLPECSPAEMIRRPYISVILEDVPASEAVEILSDLGWQDAVPA